MASDPTAALRAQPSRLPATVVAYQRRFGQLEREARACLPAPLTIEKFVTWLIDERRPRLAANSWRQVRAAARFGLERSYGPDRPALAAALCRLNDAHPVLDAERKPRTSATKAKRYKKPTDLERIGHAAIASRSQYGQALADYLVAADTGGLRPCEWAGAVLRPSPADGFGWELIAPCAKHDEVRATGETRTLRWTQSLSPTVSAIQSCIARATEAADEGRYDKLMKRLQGLMRDIAKEIFPETKIPADALHTATRVQGAMDGPLRARGHDRRAARAPPGDHRRRARACVLTKKRRSPLLGGHDATRRHAGRSHLTMRLRSRRTAQTSAEITPEAGTSRTKRRAPQTAPVRPHTMPSSSHACEMAAKLPLGAGRPHDNGRVSARTRLRI